MKRLLPVLVMALLVAACGGDGGIDIDDAWARSSARMQNAGAVYMTISAGDAGDTLLAATVETSVAMKAELHETQMSDEGSMAMQQVPTMIVPADGELRLEPGSFHIMLMQLAEPLEPGDTFPVTLTFENAGDLTVEVEVRED